MLLSAIFTLHMREVLPCRNYKELFYFFYTTVFIALTCMASCLCSVTWKALSVSLQLIFKKNPKNPVISIWFCFTIPIKTCECIEKLLKLLHKEYKSFHCQIITTQWVVFFSSLTAIWGIMGRNTHTVEFSLEPAGDPLLMVVYLTLRRFLSSQTKSSSRTV